MIHILTHRLARARPAARTGAAIAAVAGGLILAPQSGSTTEAAGRARRALMQTPQCTAIATTSTHKQAARVQRNASFELQLTGLTAAGLAARVLRGGKSRLNVLCAPERPQQDEVAPTQVRRFGDRAIEKLDSRSPDRSLAESLDRRASHGEKSPVRHQFGARDVGGFVRGEEQHRIRHLVRAAGALHRHPGQNFFTQSRIRGRH